MRVRECDEEELSSSLRKDSSHRYEFRVSSFSPQTQVT
jgi:hypothetical protein